jgi:enediyne biosynthesis protein E3
MPNEVQTKMERIQKLFLGTQHSIQGQPELEDLLASLDQEDPEFRSVAYESASMELAFNDLSKGTELEGWKFFYYRAKKRHSFHLDIGLGWAFAKAQVFPSSNLGELHPINRWMVFDGMGYYHGLFKGRRTVRKHLVPEGIEGRDLQGYNQGIGRRLWYIAKGEVKEVTSLIQAFPSSRHSDLWRGVGIACAYVGGSTQENLELLLAASGEFKQQLSVGIALAALSRSASGSVTNDIERACQVICEMTVAEIIDLQPKITKHPVGDEDYDFDNWISQMESVFT